MEIANINALFKRLDEEGIQYMDWDKRAVKNHWLCPEHWGKKKRKTIILDICSLLGMSKWTLAYFYPKKLTCCHEERCVNPACFALAKKTKARGKGFGDSMSQQDVEELAEELDMEEWRRIGTKAYLEQYNMGLPPFLRVSERNFEKAIEWLKGSQR